MVRKLNFVLMIVVAFWVAGVATSIEVANVAAGNYLPRRSESIDDGRITKWHIDQNNASRNDLRHLVETVGLLQYPFALVVLGLALFHLVTRKVPRERWIAGSCGLVAAACARISHLP